MPVLQPKHLQNTADRASEHRSASAYDTVRLAHDPEKWEPLLRIEHTPLKNLRACPIPEGTGHAPEALEKLPAEIRRGRNDRGSSPYSRPPRSPSQTSP